MVNFLFSRNKRPEDLAADLAALAGGNLVSVILHGSAAAGDFVAGRSDQNVIVVLKNADLPSLKRLLPAVWRWRKSGPVPVFFSEEGWARSVEDFPVEFFDLKDGYRVLAGADLPAAMTVRGAHLRHQIEHELKGKLLRLRRSYFESGGRPKAVLKILERSSAGVTVLLRHALRLFGETPPSKKHDAVAALAARIGFDAEVFGEIRRLKSGDRPGGDPDVLFNRYLKALDDALSAIDGLGSGGKA